MWCCEVDRQGDTIECWYGITEFDAFQHFVKSGYVLSRTEQLIIYYYER